MHISYKPLWHTLVERNMRKEDLRLAAGLTTNMIANMGKGKNISMETLVRICETLNCGILDVIELEQDQMVLTNNGLSSKKRHSNGFVAFSFGEPEKILIQTIFLPSSVVIPSRKGFSIRIQTVDKSALTVKIGLPRQIMRRTMRHRMCSGGQPMNTKRG